ncbi:MAG: helix-turn-helix domain-containing protein [Candidatus Aenigmarchaeota archaeon]|nr:helix-turn-helix domain-containing protein [Candidatus Aenigmarchaeota archaeon]
MMKMRKGKEFYSGHYDDAVKMHESGAAVKDIAQKLGLSYSCVYHWVRGIRRPDVGNPAGFIEFLRSNGPSPALEIKAKFPKHNEVFLICSRRGLGVKRACLGRKFLEYSTWYYLEGQEKLLESRVDRVMEKVENLKKNLKEMLV